MSDWEPTVDDGCLRAARRGGALRLELHRPESLNAFDETLAAAFLGALREAARDDTVRAVLITGSGRAFSAGADVKRELGGGSGSNPADNLRTLTNPAILELRRMAKPVVAAVNGPAAGVGCSVATACDLVVAAESAYFLLAFANIGLLPDGGATATIPMRIGLGRALQLALLAERLPAAEALAWGLVDRVVDDAALAAEADALVLRLAAGPTRSYAASKRALNEAMLRGLEAQLELEASLQADLVETPDFLEGVAAFTERRAPVFSGAGKQHASA